jgi:bifunctional non-homologous end joining protein LigD
MLATLTEDRFSDPDAARRTGVKVFLYVFDVLHLNGHDLTAVALRRRKALLRGALTYDGPLRFTPHRTGNGVAYWEQACRHGWEGVIAKRADGSYAHGRSKDWLKFKCAAEQEFVIGGYDRPMLERLSKQLADLEQDEPEFAGGNLPSARVHWVKPRLVGQVAFSEWTRDGRLRHPRFQGLRDDKSPNDVVRERAS